VAAVDQLHEADGSNVIVAKANCGIPRMIDGTLWYPTSSDDMTAYAELALDAGARIVGACCGSVPDHIAQIRAVVESHQPRGGVTPGEIVARLGGSTGTADGATGVSRKRRSRRRPA
jgi:5-methyltetrahydrofolate--homocysteine methyltransferase